ncbi:hypothetical protein OIN93_11750 [Staphylococcus aureus]|uniref:hypothetical protein n=1 Tax=Staphylococcus aureus TaxID=1280 RepID=UPI0013F66AFF|nr:hypothetical protein [Staphylococcus aureus]MEA1284148.1 hypothetical protein [Staphylococcus aureus]MEA1285344.1 hypothetical protein [Staphylococcus aureus]NHD33783.1 hypothetical protein [Staphylococcus aureus]NHD39043.1 hypothetical protein [Staphylococcus aureus]NHD46722.1 hypothetical protein [Staphylococcus aureus]
MFVTKEEFKNLNVKEVFESGKNFIKITDGRHAIYWVNDRYVVLDHKKRRFVPAKAYPKYIKRKLVS